MRERLRLLIFLHLNLNWTSGLAWIKKYRNRWCGSDGSQVQGIFFKIAKNAAYPGKAWDEHFTGRLATTLSTWITGSGRRATGKIISNPGPRWKWQNRRPRSFQITPPGWSAQTLCRGTFYFPLALILFPLAFLSAVCLKQEYCCYWHQDTFIQKKIWSSILKIQQEYKNKDRK